MATVYRTCNVCEAMCGMTLTVEDNRVTEIRPDPDDVFSRGHICPKGPAMREVLEDPDRLRAPLRRTRAGWETISWREALDEAAARLSAVQRDHGRDAVGMYVGNPTVHNHGTILLVQGFQRALRTRNRFDANSQDANPKLFACMLVIAGFPRSRSSRSTMPTVGSPVPLTTTASASATSASRASSYARSSLSA